mgnify:CR=1 FL=1|nr:MAG TPA: hypothetical protein [Caudoviricetes sp.]
MRLYKALNTEVLHNKEFAMGSIILELNNKCMLVSTDFHHKRKYALKVYVWLPNEEKWVRTYTKNKYTEKMWDYYRKHQQKKSHDFRKYENMMRHDHKHKGGGGGSRIYNASITDYECTNNPLHDFRRCYN